MTASTTDEALVGDYQVMINAAFDNPTAMGSASDDTTHIFNIFVELPDPCMLMNC